MPIEPVPTPPDRWAAFVHRTRWMWILLWPLAAGIIWASTPRISDLLSDSQVGFIPADMPSQQALAALNRAFPDEPYASRAAVVCVREAGLTDADRAWIAATARELAADRDSRGWRIRASALSPMLAALLESPDRQASLIVADLPSELYTHHTVDSVTRVKARIAAVPPPRGLTVEVSGSAALGELLADSARRNVDDTTFWTFVSVIVILAVIYRSPVAMSLPIVAVAASLMVSLGLVGWAASRGLPISGLVEMFTIVVVVGSGVDYCLFLFARFREQIANTEPRPSARANAQPSSEPRASARADAPPGLEPQTVERNTRADGPRAARVALARSGGAILASAGTNVAGLATLILARNRDIYTSGPTIAFAIAIATLAILTLTPALMALAGRRLLWPARINAEDLDRRGLWTRIGNLVVFRPRRVIGWSLLLLLAPGIAGMTAPTLFDTLDEYPADTSFVRGARLAYRHLYGVRDATELTLLLTFDWPLSDQQINEEFPEWLHDFKTRVRASLAGSRVLFMRHAFDPLGTGPTFAPAGTSAVASSPTSDALATAVQAFGRGYYVSGSRQALRVDIGLAADGHSDEAMWLVDQIRGCARDWPTDLALAAANANKAKGNAELIDRARGLTIQIAGDTAMVDDMKALKRWDFAVVAIAAVVVVYAILLWLLRDGLLSALLVAATLLTFAAACGLTRAVFYVWTGLDGLNFRLEFLLFIILLSLGQDYNIYVVTRIREELRTRGPADAVALAVARTGGVVSSCGLIMAATFASMIAGSLIVMKQMAIGLALGILLDTFVVRPLLIPAATFLLLRRRRGAGLKAC